MRATLKTILKMRRSLLSFKLLDLLHELNTLEVNAVPIAVFNLPLARDCSHSAVQAAHTYGEMPKAYACHRVLYTFR
jgi:hypothetical protein